MLQEIESWKIVTSLALLFLTAVFLKLYCMLVAKPTKLRALLQLQGIQGPPTYILFGNLLDIKKILSKTKSETEGRTMAQDQMSHDYEATVFPFTKKWREDHGDLFTFALGTTQVFYVGDPDMVKELATCKSLDLGKPTAQHRTNSPLLGKGILTSNGQVWVRQRKIIAPEFYMDKIKGIINLVNDSAQSLIQTWKKVIDENGGNAEITIDDYLRSFTGDVISKFCFGSNSKGEAIFGKIRALQSVLTKNALSNARIPGIRKLPTKNNRDAWALEKGIRDLILKVAHDREKQARNDQKDLLQIILEEAECDETCSQKEKEQFIVDNCKNIYLAGYESTAVTASWLMMFLAVDQEWQARVRAEVLKVCDGGIPTFDMLQKMKLLTMVIQETLRLYPPASVISREALKDIKIGGFDIPQGVNVWTMIPALHTDPKAWGPDSYSFNPNRFANGVAGACKHPHFYMPFGVGPRVCLGQNMAMIELKILMCLMVTNFTFSLSSRYVHSPAFNMVIEPEHQVPLLIKHL